MPLPHADHPLVFVYLFVLGACLGSFVGVVVDRLPRGESVVRPRSRCSACGHTLAWYDNLPLVSYLILRGRCRTCGVSFGARSLILELLTALLVLALYSHLGPCWAFVAWLPVLPAFLAITFLDIDHFWVPDVITGPLALWAMAWTFVPIGPTPVAALWGLTPALGMWAVAATYLRIAGKEGLGLGDIKLLAVMGLMMGPSGTLVALFVASLQGSVVGVLVLALGGHTRREAEPEAMAVHEDGDALTGEAVPADTQTHTENETDTSSDADEAWVPDPKAMPFGPFLVLGSLQVLFFPHVFAQVLSALVNRG